MIERIRKHVKPDELLKAGLAMFFLLGLVAIVGTATLELLHAI